MNTNKRKPLVNGGHFYLDVEGNKVPCVPAEVPEIATACAAAIKTMESGILHLPSVVLKRKAQYTAPKCIAAKEEKINEPYR